MSGPAQVFAPGEKVCIKIPSRAAGATSWTLLDYDGKTIRKGIVSSGEEYIDIGAIRQAGHYRIFFSRGNIALGPSGLIIHPEIKKQERCSALLLAPMIGRLSDDESVQAEVRLIRHSYIGSVRAQYFWWLSEPRRGVFQESSWDRFNRNYDHNGLPIHLTAVGCPPWAAAKGRMQPVFPENLRDIYNYYRRVIPQWPQGMWFFEVWNEPDIMGNGTGARTASLAKAVALAARVARPGLKIGTPSPATSTGQQWYREMMDGNGLENYVDYFCCHRHTHNLMQLKRNVVKTDNADISTGLESGYNPESKNTAGVEDEYELFRRHYRSYARFSRGLPAINTESGVSIKDAPGRTVWRGEQAQAEAIPVLLALNLHFGFERTCYYVLKAWDNNWFWNLINSRELGLGDFSPRAGWYALSKFGELYGSGQALGGLSAADPADRILAFRVKNQAYGEKILLVFWNQFGGNNRLSLPNGITPLFLDHMGRELKGDQGFIITWPMKYALLPLEAERKLSFHKERLFPAVYSGLARPTPCPIVLDLLVPPTQYTVRPLSGIKLRSGRETWLMRVHNFSDRKQSVRFVPAASEGTLDVVPAMLELASQQDGMVKVTFTCREERVFTVANGGGEGIRQKITAATDSGEAVISFNIYPDPAKLPTEAVFPIPVQSWFQERWDTGNAVYVPVVGGTSVASQFKPQQGEKVLYARCRLKFPLSADVSGYDAIVFDLDVKDGGATFSFVVGAGKNLRAIKFGSYCAGDKMTVAILLSGFKVSPEFWTKFSELHLGVSQIWSPQVAFKITDMKLVRWKR